MSHFSHHLARARGAERKGRVYCCGTGWSCPPPKVIVVTLPKCSFSHGVYINKSGGLSIDVNGAFLKEGSLILGSLLILIYLIFKTIRQPWQKNKTKKTMAFTDTDQMS